MITTWVIATPLNISEMKVVFNFVCFFITKKKTIYLYVLRFKLVLALNIFKLTEFDFLLYWNLR